MVTDSNSTTTCSPQLLHMSFNLHYHKETAMNVKFTDDFPVGKPHGYFSILIFLNLSVYSTILTTLLLKHLAQQDHTVSLLPVKPLKLTVLFLLQPLHGTADSHLATRHVHRCPIVSQDQHVQDRTLDCLLLPTVGCQ